MDFSIATLLAQFVDDKLVAKKNLEKISIISSLKLRPPKAWLSPSNFPSFRISIPFDQLSANKKSRIPLMKSGI